MAASGHTNRRCASNDGQREIQCVYGKLLLAEEGYLVVRFRGVRRRPGPEREGEDSLKNIFFEKENASYCFLFSSNYPLNTVGWPLTVPCGRDLSKKT